MAILVEWWQWFFFEQCCKTLKWNTLSIHFNFKRQLKPKRPFESHIKWIQWDRQKRQPIDKKELTNKKKTCTGVHPLKSIFGHFSRTTTKKTFYRDEFFQCLLVSKALYQIIESVQYIYTWSIGAWWIASPLPVGTLVDSSSIVGGIVDCCVLLEFPIFKSKKKKNETRRKKI